MCDDVLRQVMRLIVLKWEMRLYGNRLLLLNVQRTNLNTFCVFLLRTQLAYTYLIFYVGMFCLYVNIQ